MRIKEAIAQADELRPNALGEKPKEAWLMELEAEVREMMDAKGGETDKEGASGGDGGVSDRLPCPVRSLTGQPEGDADEFETRPYEGQEAPHLLLPPPRDRVYVLYLAAMIDFYNGEMDLYANDFTLYNQEMASVRAWWRRHHKPRSSRNWRT